MTADSVVPFLQVGHVSFNGALFVALIFQGVLGWRIRKKRVAGLPPEFGLVRRHRVLGPILALLLPLGYLAGVVITALHGSWLRHPGHFAGGTLLLIAAGATVLVSKRIRGTLSPWRTRHAALGALLLCVFLVQIYLGLNIFL